MGGLWTKIMAGDKWVKLTKLNSKGKTEWAESVGKASFQIFPNITDEQVETAKSRDESGFKPAISGLSATDNTLHCKECGYVTKAERVAFKISELDGKAKCTGCRRTQSVQNWLCPCKIIWFDCDKHARAGDVFRRIKDNMKVRRATAKSSGPSILQQVQK